jgi:hypothetical protein
MFTLTLSIRPIPVAKFKVSRFSQPPSPILGGRATRFRNENGGDSTLEFGNSAAIVDKPDRGHRCVWCDTLLKTSVNVSARPVKSQETKKFALINTGITGIHNYLILRHDLTNNVLKLIGFYS